MEGVRADAVHVGFEQAGEPGEVPAAGSMADAGRVFDQFAHLSGAVALVGQGEGVLDGVRGEQELVRGDELAVADGGFRAGLPSGSGLAAEERGLFLGGAAWSGLPALPLFACGARGHEQVFRALEPSGALLVAGFHQFAPEVLAHLADHVLVEVPDQVEAVEHDRDVGVTLPEGPLVVAVHVAGHGLDPAHPFVAGQVEEPLERRAPFAARQPEHVPALQVEDHGRVPVPVVQLELVHPEQTRACGGRGGLPPAVGRGPRVQARQPLPVDLPDDLAAQSGGQGDVRGRQPVGQQVLDQTDERQRGRAPGRTERCGRPGARTATRATRPGTVDRHDAPGTPERQMGEPARRRPVRARPPTAHGTGSGRGTQRLAGNLQHRERTSPGNPPGPEIERARGLHARARLPEPRHRRRQLQRRRRQHAPATHRRIGHRASRSHRPAWSQTIIRQAPSTPHSAQETAESQKTAKKRLMNRIFNRLLNVKGTVVEDARIADSPLRSEPVLEIRVRPRAGMLRCSRCGERRHGYDQGGGARRWRHQKIRRRRPDILRTIELGYSNARLEAFNNRIKVTIRTAYGFHHANNLIALIMLRCGGLDIRLPQPRTQPTKTAEASYVLDISVQGGRCNRSITV